MIALPHRLCDYRTTVRILDNTTRSKSSRGESLARPVNKADLIEGFITGLAAITAFSDATPLLTASELATRLSISRAAARRYLITLNHAGYAATDGRAYWLTPKVLSLGLSYLGSARLPRTVHPFLQSITAEVQESSNLALLDGHDVVYVARANVARLMSTAIEPGTRMPAQATAAGRAILGSWSEADLATWIAGAHWKAHTPHSITDGNIFANEARTCAAQGYAAIENHYELGLRGIAVPLTNRQGQVLGAIGVSMAASPTTLAEALERCLPPLRRAALALMDLV